MRKLTGYGLTESLHGMRVRLSHVNSGTGNDNATPHLWSKIKDDVRATFGDSFAFEIEEYSEHIEVHLKPNDAVQRLEARHEDLQIVPFNSCKMTIRREK